VWFAFPRSFDLARRKTSDTAKIPHKEKNAAMVLDVRRRMDSDSNEYTEREEVSLLYTCEYCKILRKWRLQPHLRYIRLTQDEIA
jgi:hypothetical protein